MFGYTFHHVGIACDDIDSTAEFVRSTYDVLSDSGNVYDPEQDATVRIFNEDTAFAIELVAGKAVEKLIPRGTTYYHLCYAVPDIHAAIEKATGVGAICVRTPKPAILFGGRLVAFVFTPLGLVEFVERRSSETRAA